jgi:aminoglycoside phosphotransferase (APT) family kinase protein
MHHPLQGELQDYFARLSPALLHPRVDPPVRLAASWGSELLLFALESGPPAQRRREELILRLYAGDDAPARAAHDLRTLTLLRDAHYPVPGVRAAELSASPLGSPFVVMERIAGQALGRLLLAPSPPADRDLLLTRFAALLASLHALDWRPFAAGEAPPPDAEPFIFVDRWLRGAHEQASRFPELGFLPAFPWLSALRDEMPCERPSLTHHDFHPGNVIVRAGGEQVVIDWSGSTVSDPRFDLAWTLLLLQAHWGPASREQTLREYERLRGAPVERLHHFEAFACARAISELGFVVATGALRPADRESRRRGATCAYGLLRERGAPRLPVIERLLASLESPPVNS